MQPRLETWQRFMTSLLVGIWQRFIPSLLVGDRCIVWHITPYEGQKATCYNSMAPCHRNWNGWVNTLIILEWTLNCPTLPPSLPSSLSSSLCPSIPPPYVPLCPFFHLQDLEVASVDAFQECEKYYIILSCVVCTWQHHHSIVVFLVITTSTAWNARFLECIRIHWM